MEKRGEGVRGEAISALSYGRGARGEVIVDQKRKGAESGWIFVYEHLALIETLANPSGRILFLYQLFLLVYCSTRLPFRPTSQPFESSVSTMESILPHRNDQGLLTGECVCGIARSCNLTLQLETQKLGLNLMVLLAYSASCKAAHTSSAIAFRRPATLRTFR